MKVWLVQVGEPVPAGESRGDRLHRTGLLAQTLARQGHEVVWWAATFDHFRKRHLFSIDAKIEVEQNLVVRMLHGIAYPSNVSVRRLVNHVQLARHFRRLAKGEPAPDVVLASLPPVELAAAAVEYAGRAGVPVVVDVRDLWPDILTHLAPRLVRPAARLALRWMFSAAHRALRSADAIIATSPAYLEWGLRGAGRAAGALDQVILLGYPRLDLAAAQIEEAGTALKALGVDPRRRIAWFTGTFGRTYDLGTVLAAARELAAAGRTDVQFVISGTGDREQQLRAEAAGLANVVFTGWIDQAGAAYMFRTAWIGLAAYAVGAPQGLPNKLFEYMRGGLPILSSLVGEGAAFLERHQCGITYRAGQPSDLARYVVELLDDEPRRDRLAAASRSAFDANYAAHVVYDRMAASLVALGRRGRAGHSQG